MSDRSNHRRVLHFAVTGVLLGAAGCTGNEPAKGETKPEAKKQTPEAKPEGEKKPEMEFAPNPGPNERNGVPPEVAPTTAVKEPPPVEEPLEEDHVNERPVKEPEPLPATKAEPEKRVNTGPVKPPEPKLPEAKPLIKVNPGPEG
jgi:hypothetical protein